LVIKYLLLNITSKGPLPTADLPALTLQKLLFKPAEAVVSYYERAALTMQLIKENEEKSKLV